MSKLADELRAIAEVCDQNPDIRGIIYALNEDPRMNCLLFYSGVDTGEMALRNLSAFSAHANSITLRAEG